MSTDPSRSDVAPTARKAERLDFVDAMRGLAVPTGSMIAPQVNGYTEDTAKRLPYDVAKAKALPVAVYCKNGQASSGAAKRLKKAGFSAVYTLDGGLRAWREAQLPVAKGRGAG